VIRVLIVTADGEKKTGLEKSLVLFDFACSVASYDESLEQLSRTSPDIVLIEMDNGRPGSPSRQIITDLKKEKPLPVITLIPAEILDGIDIQFEADDFVVGPANPAELALRIRRLLHRPDSRGNGELIKSAGLVIDLLTCEVAVNGKVIELTFKEYEMLKLLASHPGRVYTREQLLDKIWGYDYFGGDRTVDVHVRRLRSKIEDAHHTFIETVRNIGYRFKKVT